MNLLLFFFCYDGREIVILSESTDYGFRHYDYPQKFNKTRVVRLPVVPVSGITLVEHHQVRSRSSSQFFVFRSFAYSGWSSGVRCETKWTKRNSKQHRQTTTWVDENAFRAKAVFGKRKRTTDYLHRALTIHIVNLRLRTRPDTSSTGTNRVSEWYGEGWKKQFVIFQFLFVDILK